MFGINYNGLKKRNTYDETVNAIETNKTKIKYPNRKATRYLNDPHVLAITSASDLEMNEQQENMAKTVVIENVIRQMSGETNTHSVYNTYVHTPQPETAASADVNMGERLDREGQNMEDAAHSHSERTKRLKPNEMRKLCVRILKLQYRKHKQSKPQMRICKITIYRQSIHNLHHRTRAAIVRAGMANAMK